MSEIHVLQAAAYAAPPRPINLADAKRNMARLGMSLRKTEYGEFRVNFRFGEEATACYESDLPSAIQTGLAMIARRCRLELSGEAFGVSPAVVALAMREGVV